MLQLYKIGRYEFECLNWSFDRGQEPNYADAIKDPTFLAHEEETDQRTCGFLILDQENTCCRKELFEELSADMQGHISLVDLSKLRVRDKGKIKFFQKNGNHNTSLMSITYPT